MSSARAQAVCVPHRARQARTSAAAQSQPPQQRAASQRVQVCARPPVLRPGAPVPLNKGGLLARGKGVVARASDRDDEPVTATQEIPIFPLGLCAHPMGEGAGRGRMPGCTCCTCGGTAPRASAARCGMQRRPLGAPVRLYYGTATRAPGTLKRAASTLPLDVRSLRLA